MAEDSIFFKTQMELKDQKGRIYHTNLLFLHLVQELKEDLSYLSWNENIEYKTKKFERSKNSYLMSRLISNKLLEELEDNTLQYKHGIFMQPLIYSSGKKITVTHGENYAGGLLFPDALCMGIDLELYKEKSVATIHHMLSERERGIIYAQEIEILPIVFWTLKEALSKAILTGFTADTTIFEVRKITLSGQMMIAEFMFFPAFIGISFLLDQMVISVVVPKKIFTKEPFFLLVEEMKQWYKHIREKELLSIVENREKV